MLNAQTDPCNETSHGLDIKGRLSSRATYAMHLRPNWPKLASLALTKKKKKTSTLQQFSFVRTCVCLLQSSVIPFRIFLHHNWCRVMAVKDLTIVPFGKFIVYGDLISMSAFQEL